MKTVKTLPSDRPSFGADPAWPCLWLIPILWLVVTSFGVDKGPNLSTFFPKAYTLDHYKAILLPGSATR